MKSSGNELETLTNILRRAYLGKERFEVDDQWQNSVMARIQGDGSAWIHAALPAYVRAACLAAYSGYLSIDAGTRRPVDCNRFHC